MSVTISLDFPPPFFHSVMYSSIQQTLMNHLPTHCSQSLWMQRCGPCHPQAAIPRQMTTKVDNVWDWSANRCLWAGPWLTLPFSQDLPVMASLSTKLIMWLYFSSLLTNVASEHSLLILENDILSNRIKGGFLILQKWKK